MIANLVIRAKTFPTPVATIIYQKHAHGKYKNSEKRTTANKLVSSALPHPGKGSITTTQNTAKPKHTYLCGLPRVWHTEHRTISRLHD